MNEDVRQPAPTEDEGPPTTAPGHDLPPPPSTSRDPQGASPGGAVLSMAGLAGYEIFEELGRGAMGVVYRARQVVLKRDVALKMILSGSPAEEERRRFLAEAEVIASLQHPGIVQIHEFGTHQGSPFFAMEFCPGGTLARRLGGRAMEAREAAELVASLADAVQAAHEKGVIHRDLKPGNVLLTAEGRAKVADFGLARRADATVLTQSGAVVGTPAYMAPEQAAGKKEIGPAADVWALGAILYECLAGGLPFGGDSSLDIFMRILNEEPVRLRKRNRAVPRSLETICLKCLEKEPARRYASAKELGDDLRRFLVGERVLARPASVGYRASKWIRRHAWSCAALVGIVVALGAGLAVGVLKGPGFGAFSGHGPAETETFEVPGRRHALLVGVNDYTATPMNELNYSDADIEELAGLLKSPSAGFDHVRVLNTERGSKARRDEPNAANIRKALGELASDKKRDDLLLVALCGHGAMLTGDALGGKRKTLPFFLPSDADLSGVDFGTGRSERLINLDHLLDTLENSGAGTKLLVIDACRNELAPGRAMSVEGRAVPRGTAALFSCKAGEMAFESPKVGHGLFFHSLLEGLRGQAMNEDGVVTWDRLTAHVKRQVSGDVPRVVGAGARQTPHVIGNLEGDPPLSCPGKKVVRAAKLPDDSDLPEVTPGEKVPGMQAALEGFAAEINRLAKGDRKGGVNVGDFVGHPEHLSGAGAGMKLGLIEELKKQEVEVKKAAALLTRGEYYLQDGREDGLVVRLILTLRDRKGRKIRELARNVLFKEAGGNEELVKLLGLSVDLSNKTKGTVEDRNQEIKKQLERPPLRIDSGKIKASAASPYSLELLVKSRGEKQHKTAIPKERDGTHTFTLSEGDEYILKVENTTKLEAAVTVTIDGIDTFRLYDPAKERPAGHLVPPGEAREIKGWLLGRDKRAEFVPGKLPAQGEKGAIKGELKPGRITVCFHPCWAGKPPPEYEDSRSIEPAGGSPLFTSEPKPALVKRTIGPLASAISVRYQGDARPWAVAAEPRAKLARIAKEIAKTLKDESQTEVAFGEIVGPPEPAHLGAGLQAALIEELKKVGVAINQKASLTVKGEYLPIEDEEKKVEWIIRLVLTLRNTKGKLIQELVEDLPLKDEEGNR